MFACGWLSYFLLKVVKKARSPARNVSGLLQLIECFAEGYDKISISPQVYVQAM